MGQKMDYTFKIGADVRDAITGIKQLGNEMQTRLNFNGNNDLDGYFSKLLKSIDKFEERISKPITSATVFTKLNEDISITTKELENLLNELNTAQAEGGEGALKLIDPNTLNNLKSAQALLNNYNATADKNLKNNKELNDQLKQQNELQKRIDNNKQESENIKKEAEQLTKVVNGYKALDAVMKKIAAAEAKPLQNADKQKAKLDQLQQEANAAAGLIPKASGGGTYSTAEAALKNANYRMTSTKELDDLIQKGKLLDQTLIKDQTAFNKLSDSIDKTKKKINASSWDELNKSIKNLGINIDNVPTEDLVLLQSELDKIAQQSGRQAEESIKKLTDKIQALTEQAKLSAQAVRNNEEAFQAEQKIISNIEGFKRRTEQILGLVGATRLLQTSMRRAIATIQELDKTMTEAAVVTNFDIGDMWDQLGSYADRASELGVAINDVYKASTLYYQQGLNTQQVTALTAQTLKMARIAGLESAEATDRMTAALRGFNMTLDEASATNVADVYSKLAAITASDVNEISVAMTKVASLANSANMSFENTAAFLSQIIETTRESAETAGTALKTVVARFAEVKENIDVSVDSEGTELSYNKIDAALKSVGLSLDAFMKGEEGLDQVLMRLAERWDTLDVTTQRYIATQAAGSRQQSRFIALMSDYKRTVELTTAAQNAAGASSAQYAKTLDSLQTKLNQLGNAWDQFSMGILNQDLAKTAVSSGNSILELINKFNDSIGGTGLGGSLLRIVELVSSLSLLGKGFQGIFGKLTDAALGTNKLTQKTTEQLNNLKDTVKISSDLASDAIGAITKKLPGYTALSNLVSKANLGVASSFATMAIYIGAVIAAIRLLEWAWKSYQANTPEGKIKSANDALAKLQEEAANAADAVTNLNNSFEKLDSSIETLNALTSGTATWKEQLNLVNEQVIALLTAYPQLSDYVKQTAEGMLYITDQGKEILTAQVENTKNKLNAATYAGNIAVQEANKNAILNKYTVLAQQVNSSTGTSQYSTNLTMLTPAEVEKISTGVKLGTIAAAKEGNSDVLIKEIQGLIDVSEDEAKTIAENIDAFIGIRTTLEQTNKIIDLNYQELVKSNNKNITSTAPTNFIIASKVASQDEGEILGDKNEENINRFLKAKYGDDAANYRLSGTKNKMTLKHFNGTSWDTVGEEKSIRWSDLQNQYTQLTASQITPEQQKQFEKNWETYSQEIISIFGNSLDANTIEDLAIQLARGEKLDTSKIDAEILRKADFSKATNDVVKNAVENYTDLYQQSFAEADKIAKAQGIDKNTSAYNDLVHSLISINSAQNTEGYTQTLGSSVSIDTLNQLIKSNDQGVRDKAQAEINRRKQEIADENAANTVDYYSRSLDQLVIKTGIATSTLENLTDAITAETKAAGVSDEVNKSIIADTIQLAQGLDDLTSAYNDNYEMASQTQNSLQKFNALTSIAEKATATFGIKLSAAFLNTGDNLELLGKALTGNKEALIKFREEASKTEFDTLLGNTVGAQARAELVDLFDKTANGYAQVAGQVWEGASLEYVKKIQDLLNDGSITKDVASKLLLAKGGIAEITGTKAGEYIIGAVQSAGDLAIKYMVEVAKVINDIDIYATSLKHQREIINLQNQLNLLEAKYQKVCSDTNSTALQRLNILNSQLSTQRELADLYEQQAAAQLKGLTNAYQNSEILKKYINFDTDTGVATLKMEVAEADKSVVDAFLSEADKVIESITQANSYINKVNSTIKQARSDYSSLIETAASELKNRDQKKIDILQEQLDTEKEANTKLLNAVQKSFDQLRQDRDNEKSQTNISNLTRRLAYLRQDTSGSNALQIRELEKELADAKTEYQDSIVDQSLQKLNDAQEEAYNQRETQIKNQQKIIDYMDEYGSYNAEAQKLVDETLKEIKAGVNIKDTTLGELISGNNSDLTPYQLSEKLDAIKTQLASAAKKDEEIVDIIENEDLDIDPEDPENPTNKISKITLTDKNLQTYVDKLVNGIYTYAGLNFNMLGTFENLQKNTDAIITSLQKKNIADTDIDSIMEAAYSNYGEKWTKRFTTAKTPDIEPEPKEPEPTPPSTPPEKSKGEQAYEIVSTYGKKLQNAYNQGGIPDEEAEALHYDAYAQLASLGYTPSEIDELLNQAIKNAINHRYAKGGLANFTGPAWMDGTKSNPELVLNAKDTENFLQLRDILRDWNSSNSTINNGSYNFDININVDELSNDYDVNQLSAQLEQNIVSAMSYRNVTFAGKRK